MKIRYIPAAVLITALLLISTLALTACGRDTETPKAVEADTEEFSEEDTVFASAPSAEQAEVNVISAPSTAPTAASEPTSDPNSPESRAAALGLPAPPNIDITSWEFMLVNSTHKLSSDYAPPELSYLSDSQCPVDSRIADALLAFADAAKAEGLPVYLSSGYRSYNEQNYLLQRKLSQGYDYATAITIVAEPGTSEHQTGLCCDITDYYRDTKNSELEETETYKWMSQNCQEYGFIVRYPSNKSYITNIIYEPWHFRYVGVEAASYIMENDLCLEEFIALYDTVAESDKASSDATEAARP